jgi:hypothetical protein
MMGQRGRKGGGDGTLGGGHVESAPTLGGGGKWGHMPRGGGGVRERCCCPSCKTPCADPSQPGHWHVLLLLLLLLCKVVPND